MSSMLYIVATPIGNLSDITLRAVEVLKNVDYIACEDTRVTSVLAEKYAFKAKLFDCHKFNEKERSEKIINLIQSGKSVALVSDAGTPCISDPGSVLINELYKNNIKVTSIPGACAVPTFLSLVPRDTEEFTFIGFIPRGKKQQGEILNKHKYTNCIFYESPNRLLDTLYNISEHFGSDTQIAVGRELTKVFEEVKIGSLEEVIKYYENNTLKGELAVMLYAKHRQKNDDDDILEKIELLEQEGYSAKEASKIISKLYGENKNKVYSLILTKKRGES